MAFSPIDRYDARSGGYSRDRNALEERIPFDDGSFDVVYCGELIEHLYNPDAFLEECHRVIVSGGQLVITTPNLQAWYSRFLFAAGIQPIFYETSTRSTHIGAGPLRRLKRGSEPVGHVRLLNARALRDPLASQGFGLLVLRGAIFNAFPKPLRVIGRIFDRVPSLAPGFVAVSERLPDPQ